MLPELSGIEVRCRLKHNDALRPMPVIHVTAHGDEMDCVVAFEVGANDSVVNPAAFESCCCGG